MKDFFFIALFAFVLASCAKPAKSSAQDSSPPPQPAAASPASIPPDQLNAHQARELIEKGIQALGGEAYLTIRDMEEQGRTYSFYHGRPTGNGTFFWRFTEFPDKERVELTPQRDVAYVYTSNKGYEITYKGSRSIEKKDLDDYIRRHRFSLEKILRTWVNDPTVALFFDGAALAGTLSAEKVTLISAKNEAVSIYFDIDTHLPIKKSYSWRDPVDREKNTEEETYDGYRALQGVMTCFNFTRYFNGDMQTERFMTTGTYNQGFNQAMFDPNSGYTPPKADKRR
jgi:hypothetical protein